MKTALEQITEHVNAELAAGRQVGWSAAFVTSKPTRKQIRAWFDVPANLSKAESIEWLAGEALKEEGLTPVPHT